MTAQNSPPALSLNPAAAGQAEREIAEYVRRTTYDDIPPATVDAARCLILDTLGAAISAYGAEGATALESLVTSWQGAGQATIVGSGARVPVHQAVMVNATMARALEIDDVHEQGMLHPTASMLPIALAMAEHLGGCSGRDLVAAVVLGNEMAIRLGTAPRAAVSSGRAQPRTQSHTYHVGMLAGALVAGKLMGFGAEALQNAMGIAYSQCAGNLQSVGEGALTMRVQQGLSAAAGVLSAELGARGITGPMQSLTGEAGYYNALHAGRCDLSLLTGGLGRRYAVPEISIKPYPCCKHIHTAAAAAEELVRRHGFRPEQVARVVVHVRNQEYFDLVCRPLDPALRREAMTSPRGMVHAQMSLPFVVAVALVDGRVRLNRFDLPGRIAADVLSMMDRVETIMDGGPGDTVLPTPGIVDVHLEGRTAPLTAEVRHVKGHPANPMSYDEVADKFMAMTDLVAAHFSRIRRLALVEMVRNIDGLADVRALLPLLVTDTAAP